MSYLSWNNHDYWRWLNFLYPHLEKWKVDNPVFSPLQFIYLFIHLGTIAALWNPSLEVTALIDRTKWISPA